MNGMPSEEYRELALDSSNEMMEHDGRRVLGRYAEATLHILRAGEGRLRMGEIMHAAGNFAQAAADWLSAAACFDLAADVDRMRDALGRAQELARDGRIPPDRRDLHGALAERERQLAARERDTSAPAV